MQLWLSIGFSTFVAIVIAYYQVRWSRRLQDPSVSPPFGSLKAFLKTYWGAILLALSTAWSIWNLVEHFHERTPATVALAALFAFSGAMIGFQLGLLALILIMDVSVRLLTRTLGNEPSASQQQRSAEEGAVAKGATPDVNLRLPDELKRLPPEQQTRLNEFAEAEQLRARLWEYRFLNYFLVPTTQRVLDALVAHGKRTTVSYVDAELIAVIHDPNERTAILAALLDHHLLQRSGEQIEVTEKGREYQKWRGPLPPLPPPKPENPPPSSS